MFFLYLAPSGAKYCIYCDIEGRLLLKTYLARSLCWPPAGKLWISGFQNFETLIFVILESNFVLRPQTEGPNTMPLLQCSATPRGEVMKRRILVRLNHGRQSSISQAKTVECRHATRQHCEERQVPANRPQLSAAGWRPEVLTMFTCCFTRLNCFQRCADGMNVS